MQFLGAKATTSRLYPLAEIPSLRQACSVDEIIEGLKNRIIKASRLSNFHPLFRPASIEQQHSTLDPSILSQSSGETLEKFVVRDTANHPQNLKTVARLTCLLVGRLWNPDHEILEGLVDATDAEKRHHDREGPNNSYQLAIGATVSIGFISCTIELLYSSSMDSPPCQLQGTIEFTTTFRSNDLRISTNCATSSATSLHESLTGRLAMLE